MIGISGLHMNPTLWTNPKEFNPERFLNLKDNSIFLPFGIGERKCVCEAFSYKFANSVFKSLMRSITYELENEGEMKFGVSGKSKLDVKMSSIKIN
jgi:cytochrome P450